MGIGHVGQSTSSNAVAQTLLSANHDRLVTLNGEFQSLVMRIAKLGNRALGDSEAKQSTAEAPRVVRSGVHGAFQDTLDLLSETLENGRAAVERLEGFI